MSTTIQLPGPRVSNGQILDDGARRVASLENDIERLSIENAKLRELANADALTKLGNRRRFEQALDSAVTHALRYGQTVSLLMADLDGMKILNDSQGHPAGDEMLRRTANALRACTRSCDVVTRLGGDEFAIVMPSTAAAGAGKVAERMRAEIEAIVVGCASMSVSIGIAELEGKTGAGTVADLMSRADRALYAAKRDGKNMVTTDSHPVMRAVPTLQASGKGQEMNRNDLPRLSYIRYELRECLHTGDVDRIDELLQQLKDSAEIAGPIDAGELRGEYVRWKTRFELLGEMELKAA